MVCCYIEYTNNSTLAVTVQYNKFQSNRMIQIITGWARHLVWAPNSFTTTTALFADDQKTDMHRSTKTRPQWQ